MPETVAGLIEILDLARTDEDSFLGHDAGSARQRVFGGQVLAQALTAGYRTVPDDRVAHSLGAYFLRAGVAGTPIRYSVERTRDGGSFSHVLEYRAGQAGLLGQGFVAHVPHYLAQSTFPQATRAVLERVAEAGGLRLPLSDLTAQVAENLSGIEAEAAQDADFPAVVHALEEQYDRLSSSGAASVPSAEEIGAAVEQFLAEQDPPQDFRR